MPSLSKAKPTKKVTQPPPDPDPQPAAEPVKARPPEPPATPAPHRIFGSEG
jgi:hypothetical protein